MTQGHAVAITGLGCVSAIGLDVEAFWDSLKAGRSGIGSYKVARGEDLLSVKIAAQIKGFDPTRRIPADRLVFLDPFAQYGMVAADEAVENAGIGHELLSGSRTAVVIGTGAGGATAYDDAYDEFYGKHSRRMAPMTIPRLLPSSAASQVGMRYGITGPSFAVSSACASANHAIGIALWLIRSGVVDRAIAGGCEAPITPASIRAWELLRVLSPNGCRPFSKGRSGLALGEGAGMVVLEKAADAAARGVRPIAHIAGFGMTSDADDLLRPNLEGAAAAIRAAIDDAGLSPNDVVYVNAHGTGTFLNDIVETQAIRAVFGSHADSLSVSSTKSMHGHAMGAAGGLEIVATALAIRHGIVPPTANYLEPDPRCDLDYVPNQARRMPVSVAMSNSFGFGGLNAVLVLTQ